MFEVQKISKCCFCLCVTAQDPNVPFHSSERSRASPVLQARNSGSLDPARTLAPHCKSTLATLILLRITLNPAASRCACPMALPMPGAVSSTWPPRSPCSTRQLEESFQGGKQQGGLCGSQDEEGGAHCGLCPQPASPSTPAASQFPR